MIQRESVLNLEGFNGMICVLLNKGKNRREV
jgi:hypothetical protein